MSQFDINNILDGAWLNHSLNDLYQLISHYYGINEHEYIDKLHDIAYRENEQLPIQASTEHVIEKVRDSKEAFFFDIEALLQEYSLSDEDGITLMCLAEALLRVPDAETRDALITDKLNGKQWQRHFSKDNSLFVNAATWSLGIAGKMVNVDENSITGLFKRSTKPILRVAVDRAMRIMGQHFVLGRTIQEAIKNAKPYAEKGYVYSYDMLGESAITANEAKRYFDSYKSAIASIAEFAQKGNNRPSLSIKLSALYPRFEETHRESSINTLSALIQEIITEGMQHNVGITIDAEEADRLELTLAIFEKVYSSEFIRGWGKFGIVIQAYSKRALPSLCWLTKLAKIFGDEIPVRLVKGAYWDTEIKHSQELGLESYPVFTRKEYTDIAYLACARYLLSELTKGAIYPQFATHNAHTVSSIQVMARHNSAFEFQRLHGMGDDLYNSILEESNKQKVRIYAPVGSHEDLLPYLVRRLLENGANSSFVHQLSDNKTNIEMLTRWPLSKDAIGEGLGKPIIPLPKQIFKDRVNSSGINLASTNSRDGFMHSIHQFKQHTWSAYPIINGKKIPTDKTINVSNPYNINESVGQYDEADIHEAEQALAAANKGKSILKNLPVEERCKIIENLADKLEAHRDELVSLCQREAGKTIQDAIDEIREAVDFCRYYPQQARKQFIDPISFHGPTGESNDLIFEPKGIFVCISPWNFPLAIFLGQISAALLTGNSVIAKPAEATSLIAFRAIELLFECGLPSEALQFLPGSGRKLGSILNADPRVSGVVFTGSNLTAHTINQTLNSRGISAPIATLIAETGGLNAMIVDSTALPEQAAKDIVESAFRSAGQRCSALRVLYVQEDIADRLIDLVKGSMDELIVGNPQNLNTDVGPVIDTHAHRKLLTYIEEMKVTNHNWYQVDIGSMSDCDTSYFVPPSMVEIDSILSLKEEQFGPILHVVRFSIRDLEQVIQDINATGYGLTLGVHSRNQTTYEKISRLAQVGNIYINRNQIGAIVGVNPFGGQGLSGTGPKAGGPNYLLRFVTEKTITNNIAAIGGNIELLSANST
jgi:RHH-type proline utilization regulon transcriptional repressor/proline dehydrogenase/delta 1-pyrroline-5-carboxylate dehydrogenase